MIIDQEERFDSTIYNVRFSNLTDLYEYIKSNPEVNTRVFSSQSSLKDNPSFYGEPLEQAIEYCLGGYKKDFDNFLRTSAELKKIGNDDVDERVLKRGLYGGVPLAPLVAAGVLDCMLRYARDEDVKYVTIYFNLGYPHYTSESAIVNRGLATLYIIQSLKVEDILLTLRLLNYRMKGEK